MKKISNIKYYIFLFTMILVFSSCEKDNYDAPDATLQGTITTSKGAPYQAEQGQGSIKLRLEELSWSENPLPLYLNIHQDGTYINRKIFAAKYRITPIEGAFYPFAEGDMKTVDVKGTTTVDFTVTPYLDVEWVADPTMDAEGNITSSFKFTRNASPSGAAMPALKDYQMFISSTQYVGNNNFDGSIVAGIVGVDNSKEGQPLTITTKAPIKRKGTYFVRIGVRVNDSFQKYNYTDIKTVEVK